MLRFTRFLTVLLALALLAPAGALAARRTDRNHDRLPDRWERLHHLSLKVDQGPRDQDRDGLNNLTEYADHTNPRRADSDHDGVGDANEDHDGDGVVNVAEAIEPAGPAAGGGDAGSGEHHEGAVVPWDHVVSFDPGSHELVIARGDGSTVSALAGEHLFLACGVAAPGPFRVCATTNLAPGTKVIVAQHGVNQNGADAWTVVLLGVSAPSGDAPPPPAPDPQPAPEPHPAPAVTASVVSFDGGILKIHRNANGEEPATQLSGSVVIRCVTVTGGSVVSDEPCGTGALVPGAQLALAQGGLADGVFRWLKLVVVVPGG